VQGLAGTALMVLTAILLPLFDAWRLRTYVATLRSPWPSPRPLIVAWPLALYGHEPGLFAQWQHAQEHLIAFSARGRRAAGRVALVCQESSVVRLAGAALALWTVWIRRHGDNGGLGVAGVALPATMTIVLLGVLSTASRTPRDIGAAVALPLSLLATAELDTLRRGFSGVLDWFASLPLDWPASGVGIVAGVAAPWPSGPVARIFHDTQPASSLQCIGLPLAVAIFLSLSVGRAGAAGTSIESACGAQLGRGMTLVWGLYMTIWLPYLDPDAVTVPSPSHSPRNCPLTGAWRVTIWAMRSGRCSSYFIGLDHGA